MKVLLVDAAREWRGGQSQFLFTARGLLARGHEVVLAAQAGGVLETRARQAGVDVRPISFRGDLAPSAVLSLSRLMRSLRPQVVQLNDPHATGSGLLAARLIGRRGTVATRRVDFHIRSGASRWKYGQADRVIAVSNAILAILAEDGLPADRVRLVYEGVPDRTPEEGGRETLAGLGVPAGAPVIGNVAALTEHKDQATLLKALPRVFARVPEARAVIVGDGELRSSLEALARSLSLDGRCVLPGFRTDVDLLIPAFSVFCLSSRWEGLGTSLLDAMAFSRPIVATAAGGIPEAVEDGVTGRIVPVQDPQALAEALVEVLQDPARREAMGRAGRQRFLARFTADRMVDETLRVYQELL